MTALAPTPIGVWTQSPHNQAARSSYAPPMAYTTPFRARGSQRAQAPLTVPGNRPARSVQAAILVMPPAAPTDPSVHRAQRRLNAPRTKPASGATELARLDDGLASAASTLAPEQLAVSPAATVELLRAAETTFQPITINMDGVIERGEESDPALVEAAKIADEAASEEAYAALVAAANQVKVIAAAPADG